MKREEIKSIIDGITDEQLEKLLNLNNADVEKAKGRIQAQLDSANEELKTAKETITTLEANKGDAAALEAEIQRYKDADAKREEEAKKAKEKADMDNRFSAVLGDKEFSSDFARDGVYAKFAAAVADPANKGKGDAELFSGLTKDVDGVFKSKNPPAKMGGVKKTYT